MAVHLDESQQRNFNVWPILGTWVWPNPGPIPMDYAGEVQELKDWILLRTAWLDVNWPDNVGGCLHVGVADQQQQETGSVYPDPFTDRFTVQLPEQPDGPVRITLHDAQGRLVLDKSVSCSGGKCDVWTGATLNPGMYVLTAQDRNGALRLPVQCLH